MPAQLMPFQERTARVEEKRHAVLRFLRDEVYTTREIVERLLGVTATPAKNTLAGLARDGLVRCEEVICPSGWRPTLWGITAHGQSVAFDIESEQPSARVFEPGRVGLAVLNHTITLQRVRIQAERAGWMDWTAVDRLAKWEVGVGRPDALVTTPAGERWALEVELTMKTTKRYESVLFDRLRQIKTGAYQRCVWLAQDADRARRLELIVKGIQQFTREHAGQRQLINIDPDVHHPRLTFCAIDQFPSL